VKIVSFVVYGEQNPFPAGHCFSAKRTDWRADVVCITLPMQLANESVEEALDSI